MSLKKMLENYDEALLKNLEFEIRINNWIKATFKDINETERYIKLIVHNGYRWFIANDRIFVIDFNVDLKEVEKMNEFTKDSPTSEKLVAELGTKTDITICADIVHGLDYEYKQLQQENQELKNLNRIYEEIISDDKENYKLLSSEIKELKNQQKEFIDWLEDKLVSELDAFTELKVCDVLSKYKEIIGGKE